MKRQFVLVSMVIAVLLAGATLWAQQRRTHDLIMKDVQATYANLKKNLDANNTAAAVEDATKLEGLFKETEGFWAPLNTKDAVNFAKSAQEDTAAVVAAVKANDMKKAQETYTTVRNNCAGCHFSHREESGKGFSIKP